MQELLLGNSGNVDITEEEGLDLSVGMRRVAYPYADYLRLRRQGYSPLESMGMLGIRGNQTEVEDTALHLLWRRINEG